MDNRSGEDRRKTRTMLDPAKEKRSNGERRILEQIQKLSIEEGDLLVIRIPDVTKPIRSTMEALSSYVRKQGAVVVFAPKNIDFEKLNEEQMNKIGWYRKDADTKSNT